MKAVAFDYLRPRDLAEAIAALTRSEGAKLLAGGQSLGPMLNLRLARPELLVDISRLDELKRIEETDSAWRIGGGITHAQLEDIDGSLPGAELVCEVAAGIAYRSVRNRGTIGGSLAHADPAADWPLALAALDATVVVRGAKSRMRRLPAGDFILATFTTALAQDEVIEFIEVPKRSSAVRYGYFKFCRKTGDFPETSAAAVIDPDTGQTRIYLGALNGAPQPLPDLARRVAVEGAKAANDEVTLAEVFKAAPELDPVQVRMHATTVQRAIQRAFLR
ncbi:MAG: carbon monoxide dehydrogenase [Pseudolabrys sp.]|nr:carbon monoxide dehydrogenase [Pseudolabrys sp.]